MMVAPIYSNDKIINDEKLQRNIISLLSENTVKDLNSKLTFVDHGIYIFSQYREKRYIINDYAENIFWNMVSRLYVLLHDCGLDVLPYFLEVVQADGKQAIKPYPVTPNSDIQQFERATEFIENIKVLRHSEQHNMKPDSVIDKGKERKREKILCGISNKKIPQTESDWEKCIQWITNNCSNLYCLLNKRLVFLEEEATEAQKNFLLGGYYGCLERYFNRILVSVIAEVLRKRRKRYNEIYIEAIAKEKSKEIVDKSIELLKSSVKSVDPYKVILQAVDYYI